MSKLYTILSKFKNKISSLDTSVSTLNTNVATIGKDYVVAESIPSSSSTTWGYRKWKSGYLEIFGYQKLSVSVTSAAGSIYRSTSSVSVTYPTSFPKFSRILSGQATCESNGAFWFGHSAIDSTHIQTFVFCYSSVASPTIYAHVYVTGYTTD